MATPIPENSAQFSIEDVCSAVQGELAFGNEQDRVLGVTTDSRGDVGGKLFVALSGENFDGHRFIRDVLARGAAGVLASHLPGEVPLGAVVRVPDTLAALGALSGWHRRRWGGRVVAVGGSAGKTTTRAAISAVLDAVSPGRIHFEKGNLNNRVGVPMVLLRLQPQHQVCVLEIGTNARGEVGTLAQVARPDIAVLTLVALEHSEGLGGLDEIEAEEGALFQSLPPTGVAIANADDPRALNQLRQSPTRIQWTYGTRVGADYRVTKRTSHGVGRQILQLSAQGRNLELECGLLGVPGALAAAAAVAVAESILQCPVNEDQLRTVLAQPTVGEPGRLVPILLNDGTLVLDDTYNANPASVKSSVAVARELASDRNTRLLLVVGEMRELGACSVEEHRALGEELAHLDAALIVAIGGDARHLADAARRAGAPSVFVADAEAALGALRSALNSGDVILVKASRGVRAERVVAGLIARQEGSP